MKTVDRENLDDPYSRITDIEFLKMRSHGLVSFMMATTDTLKTSCNSLAEEILEVAPLDEFASRFHTLVSQFDVDVMKLVLEMDEKINNLDREKDSEIVEEFIEAFNREIADSN